MGWIKLKTKDNISQERTNKQTVTLLTEMCVRSVTCDDSILHIYQSCRFKKYTEKKKKGEALTGWGPSNGALSLAMLSIVSHALFFWFPAILSGVLRPSWPWLPTAWVLRIVFDPRSLKKIKEKWDLLDLGLFWQKEQYFDRLNLPTFYESAAGTSFGGLVRLYTRLR